MISKITIYSTVSEINKPDFANIYSTKTFSDIGTRNIQFIRDFYKHFLEQIMEF